MRHGGGKFGFVVAAAMALFLGAAAVPAAAATAPAAPAKPAAVSANAAARVTWVAPAANGAPVNEYIVTPFVGAVAQPAHVFVSAATTQLVTGLKNATVYTFRVKAHNASGTGANSVPSSAVRVGSPVAPAAPIATPGNAFAHLAWVAPANSGAAITGYIVTPFVGAVAQAARTFNTAAVAQNITGLVNAKSYTFKVAAKNARGAGQVSAPSKVVAVGSPSAPAKPGTAQGNQQVRLNWVAPANNGGPITGYVVTPFIGTTALAPQTFASTALAQDVTGLTNATNYTFRVAGKNARGVGAMSPATAVTAPTAQPALKTAMNATIGQPILVDSAGMTVYLFVPDGADTTSHVTGPVRTAWPYVTWSGAVTVDNTLTAGLATGNVQPDNTRLIAYNGHLLYTFVSDHVPGDATGQGLAQFFVLDAAGNKIP